MSKDSINEMEQIQKGLEQFLEKEVDGYKKANDGSEEEIKLDMLQNDGKQIGRAHV